MESIVTPDDEENKPLGTKKMWTYLKHCKADTTGVAPLRDGSGHTYTTSEGKAAVLNEQFISVFSNNSPLPLKFMCNKVLQENTVQPPNHLNDNLQYPIMPDITITNIGIIKLLNKLNPHKASGPDGIKPWVLKELSEIIAPILTAMFQHSLRTGSIPSDWKHANVTPIFKKGARCKAINYRPISLTCICSKLLEHVITSNLMTHLEINKILHDRQHGFRRGRSCDTQLLEFVQDVAESMNKGQQIDAIVMDFSKAFDRVAHSRLAYKLHQYGIRGSTLKWIENFLSGRSQSVVVENSKSPTAPVTSGVPQGSVIGPALFLVYINDLPEQVKSEIRLFADDTIIYRKINTAHDCKALQEDLNSLLKWEEIWQMAFHPDKCNTIHFTRSLNPLEFTYSIRGQDLDTVQHIKYLGVTLSDNLSWKRHIHNITGKASRTLGFLKRNLPINSTSIKETACKALVRPQVEYAAAVWDPGYKDDIRILEQVQKRAARWVLHRYHRTSSVTDMTDQLGWRSLINRRSDARLTMFYKILHGMVAISPLQYMQPVKRVTRHTHSLACIRLPARCAYYAHTFFPRTIIQWNALPGDVALAPSVDSFHGQVGKLDHATLAKPSE